MEAMLPEKRKVLEYQRAYYEANRDQDPEQGRRKRMNKYFVEIEVPKGELEEIMEELARAQETIRACYKRLEDLGVLVIREREKVNAASGN